MLEWNGTHFPFRGLEPRSPTSAPLWLSVTLRAYINMFVFNTFSGQVTNIQCVCCIDQDLFVTAIIQPTHTNRHTGHFLGEPFVEKTCKCIRHLSKALSEGRHCEWPRCPSLPTPTFGNHSVPLGLALHADLHWSIQGRVLCHPPINYTAFINTVLMNGPCKKGELGGGVNTAPACTHVATY